MRMHYQTRYAVVACGYYVGNPNMTTDPGKVTCGICTRSRRFRSAFAAQPQAAGPPSHDPAVRV